ncbi:unnamed protein product [Ostreobium quekettii]|uniref:Histidine phosphatase superfamily n=1 Tax=Ostreobium quekettii TaxID=121088 RepID=A0A8S1IRN1_9CHLO|nr:unnamed protein product [Ostreobium quekettii]|eukprot:evm.model.scf_139.4 EVM.evm.TU.scf_139.4   scf_139:32651-35557(-)
MAPSPSPVMPPAGPCSPAPRPTPARPDAQKGPYGPPSDLAAARLSRRSALAGGLSLAALGALQACAPPLARASLVQFPTPRLANDYYLVRAGETEAEALGYVDTNPVNKTSMINSLSAEGKRQVVGRALKSMRELGVCTASSCWFWPSIAMNAYQTAEILAAVLGVSRDRIVPEYSFLDARGLGDFDQLPPREAFTLAHANDAASSRQRPPPTTTGTPNESAEDVMVRVRQMLSVTETQYSGETVVFVAPDSDTLSVLQAAMLGMNLEAHPTLAFEPGEVRQAVLSTEGPSMEPVRFECKRPPNCL